MRPSRLPALALTAALVATAVAGGVSPAEAATPQAALTYDFDGLPGVDGAAVDAGAIIPDGAGSHAATVRGIGATSVPGPRGGADRAIALPGGGAGSGAAYLEIAPGLTDSSTGDVTISAWLRWNGGAACQWAYALGSSDQRYVFATPSCGDRMFGGAKDGSEQRASDDEAAPTTRWTHVAVALSSGHSLTTYVDGVAVATTPTTVTGSATVGTAAFSGLIGKSFYGPDPLFAGAIDDVRVDRSALTETQIRDIAAPAARVIAAADAAVSLGDTSEVTASLALPRHGAGGSALSWASDSPDIVAADGTVTRPAPGQPDAIVTLTPTAAFAGAVATGSPISVTVRAETADELAQRLRATLVVPPVVASGARLPAVPGIELEWTGSAAVADGHLVNDGAATVTTDVVATASIGGGPFRKSFRVSILSAQDAQQLVAYTRNPTSERDANQDTIARSIHLAVGADADSVTPLHDNYGIVFARGDYIGVDNVDQRGVANPAPFYFADGRLGFIATRVFMSGTPDPVAASSAQVFRAEDANGSQFDELGSIDLGTADGVHNPHAVWDSAAQRYVVSWTGDDGASRYTTVDDLARREWVSAPFVPDNGGGISRVAAADNRGAVFVGAPVTVAASPLDTFASRVADAVPAGAVPLSGALADALTARYNRVVNTGVEVPSPTVDAGQTATLSDARASLTYSDGSTASLPVDWNADDLARAASAQRGTVDVHGTVRQRDYPTMFAANRADPDIYRYVHNGKTTYLFTATDDTNNNNIASAHLPIRVADSIEALSDAGGGAQREVDLLNRYTRGDRTADGRVIAGCYWAPEIHEIGGKLSILFAPCFNLSDSQSHEYGDWTTVQAHIMQLKDGGDPADPADWSAPAPILTPDGAPLGRPGHARNISLDMTYFEAGGASYYAWSQRYIDNNALGDPLTWIARVDPAHPDRILGTATPLIAPALSWELRLAEGGFALDHDGKIYMIYSSDGVSPRYVVGGIWADADADLTDIDSWHKYNTPLLNSVAMPSGVTDYLTYPQGPGHGAVTTDEDGNPLFVYHTWGNGVAGDGRDARIGRIHWAAGDRPVLDMSAEEQVAPALRAVTMRVTVTADGTPTPTPTPTPSPTATPSPTPTPSSTPTATPTPAPAMPTVTTSARTVSPGDVVTVTVSGLNADEQVSAVLHSDPITVTGIPAADAEGRVAFRVEIPSDLAAGSHTIVISRADGTTLSPIVITVVPAGALASTGASFPLALVIIALFALIVGVAIRSRRHAAG